MGELKTIPISTIRENPVALRTVNRDTEEYQGLVDSISQKGFLGAITVRYGVYGPTQAYSDAQSFDD